MKRSQTLGDDHPSSNPGGGKKGARGAAARLAALGESDDDTGEDGKAGGDSTTGQSDRENPCKNLFAAGMDMLTDAEQAVRTSFKRRRPPSEGSVGGGSSSSRGGGSSSSEKTFSDVDIRARKLESHVFLEKEVRMEGGRSGSVRDVLWCCWAEIVVDMPRVVYGARTACNMEGRIRVAVECTSHTPCCPLISLSMFLVCADIGDTVHCP